MQGGVTICIVAGGSGGHILPAITLAEACNPSSILFFSSSKAIDGTIASHIKKIPLALPPLPGKKLWRYPGYVLRLVHSTMQAWNQLHKERPEKIISTGGQTGIPVCMAGKMLRIPIEVYELNARPGRAMSVLSKLASRIYYVFDECAAYLPKNKSTKINYPLRFSGELPGAVATRTQTLLILGGSQGSQELNKLMQDTSLPAGTSVIHQVGVRENIEKWQQFYTKRGITADVFVYRENLQDCYARATHAIARAGAGTIFELAHYKIPTVLVPLADAASHQVHNAQAIAKQNPQFTVCGPRPAHGQFAQALNHLLGDRKPH